MEFDRRTLIGSLAALPFIGTAASAQTAVPAAAGLLHTRLVPGANEQVPVVGIGTARRYADPQGEEQLAPLRATIARFVQLGGKVIDTAPAYGRAEEVVGRLVDELGVRDRLFLATKVGADNPAEGRAQIEQSFKNLRTRVIDLIAVHNLRDTSSELGILRELKAAGRVRAIGATTSSDQQYADFEATMRREKLDVVQVDYALDNRGAGERILPLAQDRGAAVMINLPFGRGRLFDATQGKPLPDWAAEIGAATWAQVFLKYIVSHPPDRSRSPEWRRPATSTTIWPRRAGRCPTRPCAGGWSSLSTPFEGVRGVGACFHGAIRYRSRGSRRSGRRRGAIPLRRGADRRNFY